MRKFEIKTDRFEFRVGTKKSAILPMTGDEIIDTYFSCDTRITSNCLDPQICESFTDEAEAIEFFKDRYSCYGRTWLEHGNAQYLLRGEIAWLEENEYDEDGEFDQGGGLIAFSAEPYGANDDE